MTVRSILGWRHWRVARWAALAPALAALWACNARSLEKPRVLPTSVYQNRFQETINRDIDIVFLIDNSSSMADAQNALNTNFPRFMQVLEGLPDGLPNVHIAVISSDMGAGVGINACVNFGNNGVFQYTAHSSPQGVTPVFTCTDTTLQGGATFIVNDNGTANYTAPIATVFQCMAFLGITGCGLEQHLLSLSRALGADGFDPPGENANFLRPDAYLGIVIIANEDDCSAKDGANSALFGTAPNTLAGTFGPVQSFRCNEFGHTCGTQGAPNRNAPNNMATDMTTYTDCVSNETSEYLKPVGAFVDEIKRLKADPANQILVAAIVGVPPNNPTGDIPYVVRWAPAPVPDTGPWPIITPGCGMNATGVLFGDPPIRIKQFVNAFGENGLLYSICQQDYGPAMADIAEKLSQLIGPKCITGALADKDADESNGRQYDCTVIDHTPGAAGSPSIDTPLGSCADGAAPPCWRLDTGNATNGCMGGSFVMAVDRGTTVPPSNLSSTVSCALCSPGVDATIDPRCW